MSNNGYQIVYIAHCSFVDKDGNVVYYNRALVRSDYEGGVSYKLVKCTNTFAENFKDFNTFGIPYFDLCSRLVRFVTSS